MKKEKSRLKNTKLNNYKSQVDDVTVEKSSPEMKVFSPSTAYLSAKDGVNFFHYLKRFKLSNKPDLMVLPLNHLYYYDGDDLKTVSTIINLKKLNLIKDMDTFLQTLSHILPPNVNFLGCFSDSKNIKGPGLMLRLYVRLNNLLDSKTDRLLDQKEVSGILAKYGFKIVDMTEIDGLTFFYSQNVNQVIKISA